VAAATPCRIAIAGESELDGVREALRGLQQSFEDWARNGPQPDAANPSLLFVCSVTRALTAGHYRRREPGSGNPVWIAVATRESLSRRQNLIASGFDYLVRWPIHSAALHMLLASALYRGDENRQMLRLAVGHPIRIKNGRSSRSATLIDLSPRGARLFTSEEPSPGDKVTLELPGELMEGKPLALAAVIVRTKQAAAESGASEEVSVGLRFQPLEHAQKQQLASLLRKLAVEPATLRGAATVPASKPARTRPRRGQFSTDVMAYSVASGDQRMISGRNLSLGGMCADPHPALRVGRIVDLTLEVGDGSPLAVRAEVVRDAMQSGVGLRFAALPQKDQQRLQTLVDSLPAIESLDPTARPAPLVARLLGRLRKRS